MADLKAQATPFRLGSKVPDFDAETTKGKINFYEYTEKSWAILFCYPQDFAAVATTELIILAKLQEEFTKRNVKLLVLSTGDSLDTHERWAKDVEEISGTTLDFPIISDSDRTISHLYHVIDDDDLEDDISRNALRTRSAFIISPDNKFRLIFNYPATVGMNSAELLRSIECLQTVEKADGIRTPANWSSGGDVVIYAGVSDEKAKEIFPDFIAVKPYLRFAEFPMGSGTIEHLIFVKGHLTSISMKAKEGMLQVKATGDELALPAM